MIDAFVEGVRSIVQVCHLVILAPVALMIIAARGCWHVVVGAVLGIVIGGWIFVTRWFILSDLQLRLSALFVIIALVAVVLPPLVREERPRWLERIGATVGSPVASAALTTAVAVVVTLWWRPCVGEELGEILTLAPRRPWSQLLPSVGFMIGISMPLVLIGLAYAAWQPAKDTATRLGMIAGSLGVLLAGSVVAGQHGEIVSRLFQWSQ